IDVRLFGAAGTPLKAVFSVNGDAITVRTEKPLAPATKRALDARQLRDQLGRLGESPFVLGAVDTTGLAAGLFIPVSELNHLRQQAVEELSGRRDWASQSSMAERQARVDQAIATTRRETRHPERAGHPERSEGSALFSLTVQTY